MDNGLLNIEQAAKFLGCSQIHLRKLIRDGSIPFVNLAYGKQRRSIRIEKEKLEKFIKEGGVKNE